MFVISVVSVMFIMSVLSGFSVMLDITVVFWGSIIGLKISAQNLRFTIVKLVKYMNSED